MEHFLEREPFLRAIFAHPEDDVPRLAYADWLEEHGRSDYAELIRYQLQSSTLTDLERERMNLLATKIYSLPEEELPWHRQRPSALHRGFYPAPVIVVHAEELRDPEAFRLRSLVGIPEWYGAVKVKISRGPVIDEEPLRTILTSPVTENVVELDLSGREVEYHSQEGDIRLTDFEIKPLIPTHMVECLSQMREVRRLRVLDLRNNHLDTAALNALVLSTNFIRLERLMLSMGNQFRGRSWQRVLERFGPDVVE